MLGDDKFLQEQNPNGEDNSVKQENTSQLDDKDNLDNKQNASEGLKNFIFSKAELGHLKDDLWEDPKYKAIILYLVNKGIKFKKGFLEFMRKQKNLYSIGDDGNLYRLRNMKKPELGKVLVIPQNLINKILIATHDSAHEGGHFGIKKTMAKIGENFGLIGCICR